MTINAKQVLVTSKEKSEFQGNTFYKMTAGYLPFSRTLR